MNNIRKIEDFLNQRKNGHFGKKASGLIFLAKKGYRIPSTLLIPYEARNDLKNNSDSHNLRKEIEEKTSDEIFYAVRSSSNIEDGKHFSSAGLFSTYLDIKGAQNVYNAVLKVWESSENANIDAYVKKMGLPENHRKMSVIIQEMVPSILSGVLFTKNPLTGFNETIIEAVEGRGDKLVQKGKTPIRWVFKNGKLTGKSQNTLPKYDDIILLLATKSLSIEKNLGFPADIEWAYNGKYLYFLQVRSITTQESDTLYSNKISREFMPGIIKPLVWDVNIPLVNGAWKDILTELIGKNNINIDVLAKQFYGRSYFNMGVIGDILQSMGIDRRAIEGFLGIDEKFDFKKFFNPELKMLRHIPRIISFIFYLLFSYEKEIRIKLTIWKDSIDKIKGKIEKSSSIGELRARYEELFKVNNEMAYYYIIALLFSSFHYKRLESFSSSRNIDMKEITPEDTQDINPNIHLSKLKAIIETLTREKKEKIRLSSFEDIAAYHEFYDLNGEFEIFFERFGHLSDSGNDFSLPQWKENKDAILKLVNEKSSKDIYANEKRHEKFINGKHRKLFLKSTKNQEYKERVSFTYNLGFSLFRDLFLRAGFILKEEQIIDNKNDIFYLKTDEIWSSLKNRKNNKLREIVSERKNELNKYESVNSVPSTIFGETPPPIILNNFDKTLRGIPVSSGYYEGNAVIVNGIDDFKKVSDGDIIVIPYSDVGWSPLFAKARAVISQAGGMLSHSAIIAREYGIPAVVSVENACTILKDGDNIYINGFEGIILRKDTF